MTEVEIRKDERARVRRMLTEVFERLEAEMVAMESEGLGLHGGQRRQDVAAKSRVQEGVALALWELNQLADPVPVVHWRNEGDVNAACSAPEPGRVAVDFADVTCEGCRIWLEENGGVFLDPWNES